VVRYFAQVSEGAMHFSENVADAGFGAVAARRQHSSQEQQSLQQPPPLAGSAAATSTHCARGWGFGCTDRGGGGLDLVLNHL